MTKMTKDGQLAVIPLVRSQTHNIYIDYIRAGSGLLFLTRFGFRAIIFDPVRFGQKMSLFGSPSGQNYFFSGQFRVQSLKGDLIFLN